MNKHLTIVDFIWQYLRRFGNDWKYRQNETILVNILQYHIISDNISRYITMLDDILSTYYNIEIEL